jgi:hypothetical protein
MIRPISMALLDGISWREIASRSVANSSQLLKHRPELLEHVLLLRGAVAAAQYAIHCRDGCFRPGAVSRALRIREKDHPNEVIGHFHHSGVDARDFAGYLKFGLSRKRTFLGDYGVQRHSLTPSGESECVPAFLRRKPYNLEEHRRDASCWTLRAPNKLARQRLFVAEESGNKTVWLIKA